MEAGAKLLGAQSLGPDQHSRRADLLGERIKAGIRASKKKHGRPRTALRDASKVRKLNKDGMTKAAIARKLGIGRTSVIRILSAGDEIAK